MTAPIGAGPTMQPGSPSFGKQQAGPFWDVRQNAQDQTLVTFRDCVENGLELPKGWQLLVSYTVEQTNQRPGGVVVRFTRSKPVDWASMTREQLARLMAGTKVTWTDATDD